jgi:hypothetical protein
VYGHYGHALPVRRHAEKEHHYRSLGHEVYRDAARAGGLVPFEHLDEIDVADYFKSKWPIALRFNGRHPPAAAATIAVLQARYETDYAHAEALARAAQPPLARARNLLIRLNYEQRRRSPILNPLARTLMPRRPDGGT